LVDYSQVLENNTVMMSELINELGSMKLMGTRGDQG